MLMNSFAAANPGASEAAAQASALGTLSWIGAAVTVVMLIVSLMLRNVPIQAPAPQTPPAQPATGK
jgi:hypothetical protein